MTIVQYESISMAFGGWDVVFQSGVNDSRATVFLFLREATQPVHFSQIVRRTKVSRAQAYRALHFLKSIGLADELHGYWFEKLTRIS